MKTYKEITYEEISDAIDYLIDIWGANALPVIKYARAERKEMTFDEFLTNCCACGGDWGQLLLTGIYTLFPDTYLAIPEDMGVFAFGALCRVLLLCGVCPAE